MSQSIPYFSAEDIHRALDYHGLVEALRAGFTQDYLVPPRMHVHYPNGPGHSENTLLVMPAVKGGEVAGVKMVTVAPDNHLAGLPSIQGVYYLLDALTGSPKALLEAKSLTNWRTAAASALASTYLSDPDSSNLLLIGTGSLANYIIEAHAAVRPINSLQVYGRNAEKAREIIAQFESRFDQVTAVTQLEAAVEQANIISVATLSPSPLIHGEWLQPGQHLDLIGAYKPDMREADDEVVTRARLYVDNLDMAPVETGDLAIPLANGVISIADIQGDLFDLCQHKVKGRQSKKEITVFKSVGHALEDLVAAQLVLKHTN